MSRCDRSHVAPWMLAALAGLGGGCEDPLLLLESEVTSGPDALTRETEAAFGFRSIGSPGVGFECRVDASPFEACQSPWSVEVDEGPHRFEVRAVAEGAQEREPAFAEWTVDLTPPRTDFDAVPPPLDNSTDSEARFSADEPSSFRCTLDSRPTEACSSPFRMRGLEDGTHTLTVEATDRAGNVEVSPPTHAWVVDASSPDTRIDDGPAGPTRTASAAFAFSSPNVGEVATFGCSLDGAGFVPCVSPLVVEDLAEGPHELAVRAADEAGNVDPTPASRRWSVDTVAPSVTITDGPEGATRRPDVRFAFEVTDDPTRILCRIDDEEPVECRSPFDAADLADGAHVFEVRVEDDAGNAGSDRRAFRVDTMGPAVTVTDGPDASGPTNDPTPSFACVADGDPVGFECQIDGAAFSACASPYTSAALADGPHTFVVRATDAAGNTGSDSVTFTVDTQPPQVTITSGPTGPTNVASPRFDFVVSGGATVVECRLDAGTFQACTSPFAPGQLSDGPREVEVRATDAAGNAAVARRAFTVDTQPPSVTLTDGPSTQAPTNDPTPTFAFTTSGATGTRCRVDGGAYAACISPTTTGRLTEGEHRFEVQAFDAAGNVASVSRSFTVDTTPPTVSILRGPPSPTNDPTPAFALTASGASAVQCRIDGGAWATCGTTWVSPSLPDGDRLFEARARDAAGNLSAVASWAFRVDTVAPTLTITVGPTGATRDRTPNFRFTTAGDPTRIQCRISPSAVFGPCTTSTSWDLAALTDGAYVASFEVRDAAGNSRVVSRSFTVDTVAPNIVITSAQSSGTELQSATYRFYTTGGATQVECRMFLQGTTPPRWTSCSSSFTRSVSGGYGTWLFDIRARDAAGNLRSLRRSFVNRRFI